MKKILLLTATVGLLLLASSAFGQEIIQMTFSGWDNQSWDSGGTGFYYGSVNGTPVGPGYASPGYLCDDFTDEIYIPESWQANAYNVSALLSNWGTMSGDTFFGGKVGEAGYLEMAYLVEASFQGTLGNIFAGATANDVSEVLWCITGGPTNCYSGSGGMSAAAWKLWQYVQANYQTFTASEFANLWLYVPTCTQGSSGCQQEMWGEVAVPEGGAALMYLLLAGVSCFGAMFLRSRRMA